MKVYHTAGLTAVWRSMGKVDMQSAKNVSFQIRILGYVLGVLDEDSVRTIAARTRVIDSLILKLKPKYIVEIGSGFSTRSKRFSKIKFYELDLTYFSKKKKAVPFSAFENDEGDNILINTLTDPSPLPDELLERAEVKQWLVLAMTKLAPKYRMVLFLRYNDHFTFKEIAESLAEPLNTVKSRHRRALIMLKKLLTEF